MNTDETPNYHCRPDSEVNAKSKSAPAAGSALAMTFKVEAAGKTIEGTMTVPDDDGTSHMPMMIHAMLKQLVGSVPVICSARSMTITASIDEQNAESSGGAKTL